MRQLLVSEAHSPVSNLVNCLSSTPTRVCTVPRAVFLCWCLPNVRVTPAGKWVNTWKDICRIRPLLTSRGVYREFVSEKECIPLCVGDTTTISVGRPI